MFAIDGCKLQSNASKEWSGMREEFAKKKEKMERAIEYILKKHQTEDDTVVPSMGITPKVNYTSQMIEKMDMERGREVYSHRMGVVEPVFANLRSTKRLN